MSLVPYNSNSLLYSAEKMISMRKKALKNSFPLIPVTIICVSNRPKMWLNVVQNIKRQTYPADKIQIIFVANTHEDKFLQWKFSTNNDERLNKSYYWFKAFHSLGKSLNFALSHANGEIVFKMDDDDIYGDNYVKDTVNAMIDTNADVMLKPNAWIYFTQRKYIAFYPRLDLYYTYEEMQKPTPVFGGCLTWRPRRVKTRFQDIGKGEDTHWVKDMFEEKRKYMDKNIKVVAGDAYNYVWIRKQNVEHTYKFDYDNIINKTNGLFCLTSDKLKETLKTILI